MEIKKTKTVFFFIFVLKNLQKFWVLNYKPLCAIIFSEKQGGFVYEKKKRPYVI